MLRAIRNLKSSLARREPSQQVRLNVDDLDFSDVFGPLPIPYNHKNTCVEKGNARKKNDGRIDPRSAVANALSIAPGLEDLEVLKLVGKGSYGKVYQVRKKGSSEIFAMKAMRKDKILEADHVRYVKGEREILSKLEHPFIVCLRHCFQTRHRIYLVFDFVNGGELLFHLRNLGSFPEDVARVQVSEVVSALSYLHENGIMHRDLKPSNILLDAEGHAVLTDFGLAKQLDAENLRSYSFCGSLEYMAPEIILGEGHDYSADWWSLGVVLYEMLAGKGPFVGSYREVQERIVEGEVEYPSCLSSDAKSLLEGLLTKDPRLRLGSAGGDEVKGHKWFGSIDWRKLEARGIRPLFVPEVAGKQCTANFDECCTGVAAVESPASTPRCSFQEDSFRGFNRAKPGAPTMSKL